MTSPSSTGTICMDEEKQYHEPTDEEMEQMAAYYEQNQPIILKPEEVFA